MLNCISIHQILKEFIFSLNFWRNWWKDHTIKFALKVRWSIISGLSKSFPQSDLPFSWEIHFSKMSIILHRVLSFLFRLNNVMEDFVRVFSSIINFWNKVLVSHVLNTIHTYTCVQHFPTRNVSNKQTNEFSTFFPFFRPSRKDFTISQSGL